MYEQHIIVDFEMNPVAKKNGEVRKHLSNEIIEIGAVKLDSNNQVVDRFSCLIKPKYNEDIASFITGLTGIKTGSVKKAYDLKTALNKFALWIGEGKTRIYSWSDTDLRQLQSECSFKNLSIPANMRRWMDFQVVYPRVMDLDRSKKMSLTDAAQWYGVFVDKKKAHRALYDAEITAELVIPLLTGEYKRQAAILKPSREVCTNTVFTLGDACGDVFRQFLAMSNNEVQFAR